MYHAYQLISYLTKLASERLLLTGFIAISCFSLISCLELVIFPPRFGTPPARLSMLPISMLLLRSLCIVWKQVAHVVTELLPVPTNARPFNAATTCYPASQNNSTFIYAHLSNDVRTWCLPAEAFAHVFLCYQHGIVHMA